MTNWIQDISDASALLICRKCGWRVIRRRPDQAAAAAADHMPLHLEDMTRQDLKAARAELARRTIRT